MQDFDVVIIGAGPAGGQCARTLAGASRKILLVEQHKDFYQNNYSSAGILLETLKRYDLPDAVVGRVVFQIWILHQNPEFISIDKEANDNVMHLVEF
ncbi:MAG TPA: FAD-dependent oxidoreductase, partial [Candidatus Competibacteraceae bacterium]|nr:FAD-dependent oxidoreductase [Candidatus Competibacteraceae bacterium]